jgi:hypothetical protein
LTRADLSSDALDARRENFGFESRKCQQLAEDGTGGGGGAGAGCAPAAHKGDKGARMNSRTAGGEGGEGGGKKAQYPVVQLRMCEGMRDAAQEGGGWGGDAESQEKLSVRRSDRRLRRCWTEPFSTVQKAASVGLVPVTLSHCGYVYSVVRCGELICSAGGDGMIKVWSFDTLALLANLTGHRGSVTCLASSQKSACSRSLLHL